MLLALAGGMATLVVVAWLFVGPSLSPAMALPSRHVSATTERLAVLDGETLRIGDRVVQLEGITAPARGSPCPGDDRAAADCGAAAANALAALLRGNAVDCTIRGHDRLLGDCFAGGTRLNRALVRAGWARAEAAELREAEAEARVVGRGMWRNGS